MAVQVQSEDPTSFVPSPEVRAWRRAVMAPWTGAGAGFLFFAGWAAWNGKVAASLIFVGKAFAWVTLAWIAMQLRASAYLGVKLKSPLPAWMDITIKVVVVVGLIGALLAGWDGHFWDPRWLSAPP
jgi:uncharacterized membrane protein